jgi:hypothetical protein
MQLSMRFRIGEISASEPKNRYLATKAHDMTYIVLQYDIKHIIKPASTP